MARHHTKTLQQRQTEQRLSDDKDRAVVEEMASRFSCSTGVANDFASQCETRIEDLDFDLICSDLALGFWSDPPEAARPVVEVLRELEAERRRHLAALTQLRERLLELTKGAPAHHHLTLPNRALPGSGPRSALPRPEAAAGPEFRAFR
ncbi:MAG: hypothetical protein H7138_03020 [Myxococcales bacterium]|nr:hypothetical protein [Myxococcales bacterium]